VARTTSPDFNVGYEHWFGDGRTTLMLAYHMFAETESDPGAEDKIGDEIDVKYGYRYSQNLSFEVSIGQNDAGRRVLGPPSRPRCKRARRSWRSSAGKTFRIRIPKTPADLAGVFFGSAAGNGASHASRRAACWTVATIERDDRGGFRRKLSQRHRDLVQNGRRLKNVIRTVEPGGRSATRLARRAASTLAPSIASTSSPA
jgi:hypothetical protein